MDHGPGSVQICDVNGYDQDEIPRPPGRAVRGAAADVRPQPDGVDGLVTVRTGDGVCSLLGLVTRITATGFSERDFNHCDWADVTDAALVEGKLRLKCKDDVTAVIQRHIVSDSGFVAALGDWLPREHPVNRALKGPAQRGSDAPRAA